MNPRRLLLLALGAGITGPAASLRAQTSSGTLRRVGVLAPSTRAKEEITLKPFFDQMRELGWIEGQNIAYDRVYADDQHERLSGLAVELVARRPEVIYAPVTPTTVAAKQATKTIPIVFGTVWDPVGIGLVASLGRPGGNVTGISSYSDSLAPKRVELLRQIMPGARRLGFLGDLGDPTTMLDRQALAPLAAPMGLSFVFAETVNTADFDAAVARLLAERVDAIFPWGSGALVFNLRPRLIELASQKRLPVIGNRAQLADAGALFAFGASLADQLRRSALLVDKILKGAKPADLPIEQATLFELVVNLRTAKALGLAVPRSILLRADRVIE
jgi:putative tryptophan/tyrosine transport system substrate-binding protein